MQSGSTHVLGGGGQRVVSVVVVVAQYAAAKPMNTELLGVSGQSHEVARIIPDREGELHGDRLKGFVARVECLE